MKARIPQLTSRQRKLAKQEIDISLIALPKLKNTEKRRFTAL